VRPERPSLLRSYLSSPTVGRCIYIWSIFSYVLPYFGNWLLGFVLTSFQRTSAFFAFGFLPCFLVFFSFFMPKRIGMRKLFTKLGCCRMLCSSLRGQVVNCSQCSLTMLLSKLTPGAAKPLTRPEYVLSMGPRSATDGGPSCLSLVLYPACATDKPRCPLDGSAPWVPPSPSPVGCYASI
jgi:hypothetical protein